MKAKQILSRILPSDYSHTPPVISLLSANLIMIVFAIIGNWDAATVFFIYWVQSIIIGLFTVITILGTDTNAITADMNARHKNKGENVTIAPRHIWNHKLILGVFFAIHYGIFHLAYYDFIVISQLFGIVDFSSNDIWFSCGFFFINHFYSYLYYRNRVRQGDDFINYAFIIPYSRIIPMHLTIMFGAFVIIVLSFAGIESTLPILVVFLLLKTGTDLAMHLWKHEIL